MKVIVNYLTRMKINCQQESRLIYMTKRMELNKSSSILHLMKKEKKDHNYKIKWAYKYNPQILIF